MSNHWPKPKRVCPACNIGSLRIRNSFSSDPLLYVEYLQCQYAACGVVYRAFREITHELSPSGLAMPAVNVPPAPSKIQDEVRRAYLCPDDQQTDLLDLLHEDEEIERES